MLETEILFKLATFFLGMAFANGLIIIFKKIALYLKTQKINSESDKLKTKFYLGQKVKVCGDLETVIKRIDGDKYYFCDETGREWSEVADAIEVNQN